MMRVIRIKLIFINVCTRTAHTSANNHCFFISGENSRYNWYISIRNLILWGSIEKIRNTTGKWIRGVTQNYDINRFENGVWDKK